MKNLKKKNNKGFSLVELIVVVMIMAILSVALAPQVMKWVGNARKSADVTAYNSLYSGIELALADEAVLTAVKGASSDIVITMSNGTDITILPAVGTLNTKLQEILGSSYSTVRSKVTTGTYSIVINHTTGAVAKGATTPSTTMD